MQSSMKVYIFKKCGPQGCKKKSRNGTGSEFFNCTPSSMPDNIHALRYSRFLWRICQVFTLTLNQNMEIKQVQLINFINKLVRRKVLG